jgi:hypothetical protein
MAMGHIHADGCSSSKNAGPQEIRYRESSMVAVIYANFVTEVT